jgi:S-adenosylmethionine hydrolase
MVRPVIALLTDFGTRDAYVGAMKGVVLAVCPDVTLVDLTHDIPPQDVRTGARVLADCCDYYPAGTIFVAVVDPGVGSARRALAIDAGHYRFVGPDNGVLSAALARHQPSRLVELTERTYQRPTVSRTFEGRDRFAPAAAWLARGVAVSQLGRDVSDYARLDWPLAVVTDHDIAGVVDYADRFGNLVTNIPRQALDLRGGGGRTGVRACRQQRPARDCRQRRQCGRASFGRRRHGGVGAAAHPVIRLAVAL